MGDDDAWWEEDGDWEEEWEEEAGGQGEEWEAEGQWAADDGMWEEEEVAVEPGGSGQAAVPAQQLQLLQQQRQEEEQQQQPGRKRPRGCRGQRGKKQRRAQEAAGTPAGLPTILTDTWQPAAPHSGAPPRPSEEEVEAELQAQLSMGEISTLQRLPATVAQQLGEPAAGCCWPAALAVNRMQSCCPRSCPRLCPRATSLLALPLLLSLGGTCFPRLSALCLS